VALYRQVPTLGHYATSHFHNGFGTAGTLFPRVPLLLDRDNLLQHMSSHTVEVVIQKRNKDLSSSTNHWLIRRFPLRKTKGPLYSKQNSPVYETTEKSHSRSKLDILPHDAELLDEKYDLLALRKVLWG